jgi:hypothetical protein
MAEEQIIDTPQTEAPVVEEPRSVDVQDEGSLVEDVIFGGAQGSLEEAFDKPETPVEPDQAVMAEEQVQGTIQEPSVETPVQNDEVRYQYWQSQADKLKNQNEVLMQQLQVNQQPQIQPQQEEPVEPEIEMPEPPEKPQRPYNFTMDEAMSDPQSESARFVQEEQSWRDSMDDYKNMQFEYQMAMLEDERDQMQQQRQEQIQRQQAEQEQVVQLNNIKQEVMTKYSVDENTALDFVNVMSDPNSISMENLWKLYSSDKGLAAPSQTQTPSMDFQQVKRAQQVPPSMGVMPSQNRQNEDSMEDKIMDSMITDYGKQNPF